MRDFWRLRTSRVVEHIDLGWTSDDRSPAAGAGPPEKGTTLGDTRLRSPPFVKAVGRGDPQRLPTPSCLPGGSLVWAPAVAQVVRDGPGGRGCVGAPATSDQSRFGGTSADVDTVNKHRASGDVVVFGRHDTVSCPNRRPRRSRWWYRPQSRAKLVAPGRGKGCASQVLRRTPSVGNLGLPGLSAAGVKYLVMRSAQTDAVAARPASWSPSPPSDRRSRTEGDQGVLSASGRCRCVAHPDQCDADALIKRITAHRAQLPALALPVSTDRRSRFAVAGMSTPAPPGTKPPTPTPPESTLPYLRRTATSHCRSQHALCRRPAGQPFIIAS